MKAAVLHAPNQPMTIEDIAARGYARFDLTLRPRLRERPAAE